MVVLAATLVSGSAFAQVDSTKTDSTVVATDSTQMQDQKDEQKEDKKEDTTVTPTPPQAFVAPSVKSNTYVLAATNRELMGNRKTVIEAEKQEA